MRPIVLLSCLLATGCALPGLSGAASPGRWEKLETGTADELRAIDFGDARTGLIVSSRGTIYRTLDGAVWQGVQPPGLEGKSLRDVSFGGPGTAWLVTDSTVMRSDDLGNTWTAQWNFQEKNGDGVRSVRFVSPTEGYVFGGRRLYRTTDAGASWAVAADEASGGATAVAQTAAGVTFADGRGRLRRFVPGVGWITTLDVATDAERDGCSGCAGAFAFPSASEGWYYTPREGFLRTTDAGATWSTVAALTTDGDPVRNLGGGGDGQAVLAFGDPTVGWLRMAGAFLTTVNGGATWEVFPPKGLDKTIRGIGRGQVSDVHLLSARQGWAVGQNGLLLRYTR